MVSTQRSLIGSSTAAIIQPLALYPDCCTGHGTEKFEGKVYGENVSGDDLLVHIVRWIM